MNTLNLEGNRFSPKIYFDLAKGIIKITGKAQSSQNNDEFERLISWVELYCRVPNKTTRVDIELDNCSASSTKFINQVLWMLVEIHKQYKTQLTIFWFIDSAKKDISNHIQSIEDKIDFKIYKLSPLLT